MGRWEAEASRELVAQAGDIWALWDDADRWADWNPAIAGAALQGPFAVGTAARIRFRGRPAMTFTITAIEPRRLFVDETRLPGARMGHEHRLAPSGSGATVGHCIYFDGPLAALWGALMGRRIRRDLQTFLELEQAQVVKDRDAAAP
jgi:Polyketide cyclase / dehydrase and lipid transport